MSDMSTPRNSGTGVSRRDFLKRASVTGLALVGASCAAPAAPAGDSGDMQAEPTTLTVWVGNWMLLTYDGLVTVFEETNPGLNVELAELGEAVYGNPKYVTAVAAGQGPDVAYQNRHTFSQFAARGLYRAIDDLFTRDGLDRDDFPATQMDELTWEGVLYGLPNVVDTRYFFYNRQHFEEAGLDPDVPPATWEDLITFTEQLSIRDGDAISRYGFIPGFPPGLSDQLLIFAIENGAKTYTPDFRTCLLDQPEWIETLQWVSNFYDDHCDGFGVSSGAMSGFAGQAQDAFVQDVVSMTSYGSWMISRYAAFPDLDYDGTAAMPVAPSMEGQNINWACDWSWVLDPNSENAEDGWTFLKYVISPEGFRSLGTVGLDIAKQDWERQELPGEPVYAPPPPAYRPSREMMTEEFYSLLPPRQRKMKDSEIEATQWAQGCGNLGGMAAAEIWTAMKGAWENALTGQSTPEEALIQAQADVQKALDATWVQLDS